VFLDKLKKRVVENRDTPYIQGGVLRDPESSNLTETELLGISFIMIAVRYSSSFPFEKC
jgi:3-hydroxyphenylacetate 6-hydroxylase